METRETRRSRPPRRRQIRTDARGKAPEDSVAGGDRFPPEGRTDHPGYIEAHKGDTVRAVPVMGELPADLASHVASGKYAETVYVRVSKDGLADEAFTDSACSKKIEDPYLESVVRSIRFKPALADGKPVEGVASLNLSKLGS